MVTMEAIYCVKCKSKTGSVELENITMKNGKPATACKCSACGTKKFRIGAHLAQ